MIHSKLGTSFTRSSRYRNVINGATRGRYFWNTDNSGALALGKLEGFVNQFDGKLEFIRGYLAAFGGNKQQVSRASLSDLKCFAANPRVSRFFSSEPPKKKKKNYENFYPKGKRENPKKDEQKSDKQKSESKEEGSANSDDVDFQKVMTALLAAGMVTLSSASLKPHDEKQISFQGFKNKLLEPGLVDHIVICDKSVAKVYVRNSPQNQSTRDSESETPVSSQHARAGASQYMYYFTIGSVETFEEKLEEAQEALGIDPHDYVPVTYVSEMAWFTELIRFAPYLLLFGFLIYMMGKMQSGFGLGGSSGKGGRGIFNIGKAHFTKMDKNAKNKDPVSDAKHQNIFCMLFQFPGLLQRCSWL